MLLEANWNWTNHGKSFQSGSSSGGGGGGNWSSWDTNSKKPAFDAYIRFGSFEVSLPLMLGTEDSSGDWAKGAATAGDGGNWNVGGASSDLNSWGSKPTSDASLAVPDDNTSAWGNAASENKPASAGDWNSWGKTPTSEATTVGGWGNTGASKVEASSWGKPGASTSNVEDLGSWGKQGGSSDGIKPDEDSRWGKLVVDSEPRWGNKDGISGASNTEGVSWGQQDKVSDGSKEGSAWGNQGGGFGSAKKKDGSSGWNKSAENSNTNAGNKSTGGGSSCGLQHSDGGFKPLDEQSGGRGGFGRRGWGVRGGFHGGRNRYGGAGSSWVIKNNSGGAVSSSWGNQSDSSSGGGGGNWSSWDTNSKKQTNAGNTNAGNTNAGGGSSCGLQHSDGGFKPLDEQSGGRGGFGRRGWGVRGGFHGGRNRYGGAGSSWVIKNNSGGAGSSSWGNQSDSSSGGGGGNWSSWDTNSKKQTNAGK